MALIKNDITISNEEFENALMCVDNYFKIMPDAMKLSLNTDIENFVIHYINSFLKVFNEGKDVDSMVTFYNFNNEQILKIINYTTKEYSTIKAMKDNFEINNGQDTADMANNYLYFYDFVFQHVLDYIEPYNMNLVKTENSINEISNSIVSCCLNSLSKKTKDNFFKNFGDYKSLYQELVSEINIIIRERFGDILQNDKSVPQL